MADRGNPRQLFCAGRHGAMCRLGGNNENKRLFLSCWGKKTVDACQENGLTQQKICYNICLLKSLRVDIRK